MPFPFDLGLWKNLEMVLGRRVWAWALPLPSRWQLAGLGDGLTFETFDGSADYEWPSEEVPSYSSGSSEDNMPLARGPLRSASHAHSDADLRVRYRRDSEGYILPAHPTWSGFRSDPSLANPAPL